MTISIIIVSYNVKYFLEQCLCSIQKSISTGENTKSGVEIFVIDNNSSDGTPEFIKERFPFIRLIINGENTGFARANNQALLLSKGEYVLFLNPDTILPEDFFNKSISSFKNDPLMGAVGVQMINGEGQYLPESKRGFPSSWVAFTRLSGLSYLFPQSKIFAKYYLGQLDKNENHEVEALSGACMLVKKKVLDITQGFDERFFMYAEDIDLSFRIQQAGYKTFYLGNLTIIHFKGSSTVKNRRYVQLFYKAMIQFVEKHYNTSAGRTYATFLKLAIWTRGLFAFGSLQVKKIKTATESTMVGVMGNRESIEEIRGRISPNRTLAHNPLNADEIILCEGQDYSFIEAIHQMKTAPGKNYKIHSKGSSGIIG